MNRMCPAGGSNAYGVPSDASRLRQRAAEQHAARFAGAQHLHLRMRRSGRPVRRASGTRENVSRS